MSAQEQKAQAMRSGGEPLPTSQAQNFNDAVPSSLGRGVTSENPADETEARNATRTARPTGEPQNENEDAEQLATFGEGQVAGAVDRKSGTQKVPGETVTEDDYVSDMTRKKQEQAAAREAIMKQRQAGVDVDGGMGQRAANESVRDV